MQLVVLQIHQSYKFYILGDYYDYNGKDSIKQLNSLAIRIICPNTTSYKTVLGLSNTLTERKNCISYNTKINL